jgi:AAA family ATP:ADP antiporter
VGSIARFNSTDLRKSFFGGVIASNEAVEIGTATIPAESTWSRWLHLVAPVKRNEVLTVALLALNCFTLLTCYYVLKVVREPLILLGGGAELKSYASAGQTILLLAVVPAFSWLSGRVSRIRLMTTMQIIFIGCLVGFYVLAQAKAPIGLAFYLWVGIFNVLVISNFWSFANDLYTEEEGKRLFAVIGIGASVGAVIGAFVPHMLHAVLGLHGLMLVAVTGLGVSIFLYQIVDRRELAKKHEVAAEKKHQPAAQVKDKKGGFGLVIRDRYLRLMAGMLLVATVVNSVGEYVIGKLAIEHAGEYADKKLGHEAAAPTPDPKATPTGDKTTKDARAAAKDEYITTFYSSYYTLVNIVSALLQALVVARLLVALGVRRSLFIMPLIVLGGWFALAMFVNITLVRVEKTTENSLDYSLHNTLRQALFLPTSAEAKYKAKAAIDTFFFRMGDVIAGIGIVFLFNEVFHLGVRSFAILNVALTLVWLVFVYRTGKLHDQLVAEQRTAEPAT